MYILLFDLKMGIKHIMVETTVQAMKKYIAFVMSSANATKSKDEMNSVTAFQPRIK